MTIGQYVGERVYVLRIQRGLSQEALAQRSRMRQSTISRLEAGQHDDVSLSTLQRLMHGLSASPQDFAELLCELSPDDATAMEAVPREG